MKPNPISGRLAGLSILVVEDGADNQRLFKHFLQMAGARAILVEDGPSALERALSDESIDLVLMDIQIPIMDGYAVTKSLREKGFTRPIIAVTAHALDQEAPGAQAGITDFLAKPIEIERLIQIILRHMSPVAPRSHAAAAPAESIKAAPQQQADAESYLLSRYHSNPLYQTIIVAFVENFQQRIEAMQALIQAMDWENLAVALHQMKGAAATYGFPQVSATVFEMEQAAKDARRDAHALQVIRQKAELLQSMGARMRLGLRERAERISQEGV